MRKHLSYAFFTASMLSLSFSFADESPQQEEIVIPEVTLLKSLPEAPFKPFTGKVKGKKVRLRVQPDLEGHVFKELNKNDVISIVGEKNEFWAVEPPAETKAYVFRSYILDNVVEGNRVNVRLKPDLEAPVIGHLSAGEHIDGVISALNNKWYEIAPPSNTRFYIAKEFVDNIGGPDVKSQLDKRKQAVEQLMDAAMLLSKAELRKSYNEIDLDRLKRNFKTIISDYADFPDYVEKAKESLAFVQESYLQKKIAFLEDKANPQEEYATSDKGEEPAVAAQPEAKVDDVTERMKMWAPIEEGLYLSWMRINEDRTMDEFYDEEKLTAVALSGILESYISPVKNKPGDYILREKDMPVAYLYSTSQNLSQYAGKKIRVIASPRSNNNFAFPAYYVHSIE